MDGKIFLNKFFPFLVVISFFKGIFVYVISYSPFDLYSAICLGLIPLLRLNFYSFLSIFLLSILKALETYYISLLFIVLYFFLFFGFQYFKKIFKTEKKIFILLFWTFSVFFFIVIQTVLFFDTLSLAVLDYHFWINFIVKLLGYLFLTFLFCIVFNFILKKIISAY